MSNRNKYRKSRKHRGMSVILFLFFICLVLAITIGKLDYQETSHIVYADDLKVAENDQYDAVEYKWRFVTTRMRHKEIDMVVKLLEKEIQVSYDLLFDIENMDLQQLGVTIDYHSDRSKYRAQYFEGIYKKLYENDSEVLDRIAALFEKIADEEKLSKMDTIHMIVSMVQNIKYDIPKLTSVEVLSPTLCIDYQYGDCDTKTLLLLGILRKIGVDCVHLDSEQYGHAMIGISVPSDGEYISYQGEKYYFLETTNPGWYIGVMPPDVKNKLYWQVLNY